MSRLPPNYVSIILDTQLPDSQADLYKNHKHHLEIMEVSRKRKLSAEATFLPQLKCYVDENIQNKQSEKKMQEIYSE